MRRTVRIRVIFLGFQLAMRRRRTVHGAVLLLGIRVRHDASFHHRDHGRVTGEDRGRVLAGDGDGDILHVPGALVVTHGHMEGQGLRIALRQPDDLRMLSIQIEGVFARLGIDLQRAVFGLERILHFDAFRAVRIRQLTIPIIIQQAVGKFIPFVHIQGRDITGDGGLIFSQFPIIRNLDLRRIVGAVDGEFLRYGLLGCRIMLVTNVERDLKGEFRILTVGFQSFLGSLQQLQRVLAGRLVQHQLGHLDPAQGKDHGILACIGLALQGNVTLACCLHPGHIEGESVIAGIDIAGRKLAFHFLGLIDLVFCGVEFLLVAGIDRIAAFLHTAHAVSIDVLGRPLREIDGRTVVGAVDIDGGRMFAVRTAAVLVLDLERDIDAQVHVLRQTVQAILIWGKGISQLIIRAVLLQFERAQRDDLTVIDAGDGSLQRVDAVSGLGDGVGGVHHSRPIWRCHIQRLLDPQRQPLTNDQTVRIVGILLVEGDSYFLRTCIPAGKRTIRVCCSQLAAPNASFIHIQRRFRIVREHRLVVRAFDGDGDGLFRPGPPVVHDADHKGFGHGLALAQLRDGIVLLEFVGIVPVLVQGQGAVLRGGDIAAVTILGDLHSTGSQTMAAAILPLRGGGQPFGIAIWLQGELQAVVLVVCGRFARAVFTVDIRSLHTAGELDHGSGRILSRAIGMQMAIRRRYFLAGGIEELFAVQDIQRRPVIGAGHRDRHFLAGPGAVLVLDEDGEGLRQRLAFIEVVEPVVLRPVASREIAVLVQPVRIAAVRSDGQAAVLTPDGDSTTVSGEVNAIRGSSLASLHSVDEFCAVIGILACGLVAVRGHTVIPADLVISRSALVRHADTIVIRPIDHGAIVMTAHAAFRDVQGAVAQLQTGFVVGTVDGDGDVGGNFLVEGILDRDGKGLGQHLALGQPVDGIAVLIKSAGLELIGIGTVRMEGQRTVGGFVDGRAVGGVGLELRLGDRRAIFSCLQRSVLGFHREDQLALVSKVHVRGRDLALQRGCRVMLLVDMTISIQNWPFGRLRIAVTVLIVDALFLEDEILPVRDDRERARAFHLDDDLLGVVSAMLIHHGDLKGLEMGVLGIELLNELALAVDHIGPAAVRIDGQGPVVGGERGGSFSPTFTTDVTIRRVAIGDIVLAVLCMAAALDVNGLVETRVGIDVRDLEAARNFGPIRGIIGSIGIVLLGHERGVDDIPRSIHERQLGLVVGARDGDGHGLQIPGAVLVLHIDGEGIRHLGVFRQLIDVLDRNGLITVQRDRGTFRQLHLLTLQGVDPGAVTAQSQMAKAPFHGLVPLVSSGGILFQKVTFAGGICTFPALVAFLALVTGHSAEPQLVSGVHVMAGHGARQLLGAIVLRILRLGTRSIHDLVSGIIAAYAALEQVQFRLVIVQLHCGLVIGTRDGDGHILAYPGALVVLHEDGEGIRHRSAFRQVVQSRAVAKIPAQYGLKRILRGIGGAIHRDGEAQQGGVIGQRIGIGGLAAARFLHLQRAVIALGRDRPIGIRQAVLRDLCRLALLAHGKVQGITTVDIRS